MDSSYSVLLSVEFVKENPEDLSKRTENAEFPFQSLWKPKKFRYFSISLLTKKRGYVIIKYKFGKEGAGSVFSFSERSNADEKAGMPYRFPVFQPCGSLPFPRGMTGFSAFLRKTGFFLLFQF